MEIIDKRKQSPVYFKDIEPGELFEKPGWRYCKLQPKADCPYNAMLLLTGDLDYFPDNQMVIPLKGECVIHTMETDNEDE